MCGYLTDVDTASWKNLGKGLVVFLALKSTAGSELEVTMCHAAGPFSVSINRKLACRRSV